MNKFDIKTTDKETLRKWFHLMTLGRAIDEKVRPIYFSRWLVIPYALGAGHDGIQLAMGQVFGKIWTSCSPYYRDMLYGFICRPYSRGDYPERFIQSDRPGQWRKTYVQPLCQTGMEHPKRIVGHR